MQILCYYVTKMANKPIKVIVLEGDLASLTALGFPMAVGLQLQQSCLSLSEAMWTTKSTNGGLILCQPLIFGLPLN